MMITCTVLCYFTSFLFSQPPGVPTWAESSVTTRSSGAVCLDKNALALPVELNACQSTSSLHIPADVSITRLSRWMCAPL